MAVDMFLALDGVKGESADSKHKGECDILAWSWGIHNTGTFQSGSGGGTGKSSFNDISVTKYVDVASPNLMLFCANGKHVAKATITVRKAGENPLEYLTIKLTKVLVSSYTTGGSGSDERLTENVSLNFAQVAVSYASQDATGAKSGSQDFGWNIAENIKA
jgi:type VI secretion system secreted protein Hcp